MSLFTISDPLPLFTLFHLQLLPYARRLYTAASFIRNRWNRVIHRERDETILHFLSPTEHRYSK